MKGRTFIDTNVLVYAYDRSEPTKQNSALKVLDYLATRRSGVMSVQVLAEFFWVVTRSISVPIDIPDAYKQVEIYIRSWTVLDLTQLIVLEAVKGTRDHKLSYWDAQIWATAKLNQISVVLSEDFSDGVVLEGVRFLNPFAPMFQIEMIGNQLVI